MSRNERNEISLSRQLKDGTVVEVRVISRDRPHWVYPQAGRPFMSSTDREYRAKPRVYFSVDNESVLGNLVNRSDRPFKTYRTFLPTVINMLADLRGGYRVDDAPKLNWSQHAGCSTCPCSPGFIMSNALEVGVGYYDVWVRVTGPSAPAAVAEDANEERRASRFASVMADPTLAPLLIGVNTIIPTTDARGNVDI